jgi:hypothetical protein
MPKRQALTTLDGSIAPIRPLMRTTRNRRVVPPVRVKNNESVAVLSLAGKRPRTAECDRTVADRLRNRDFTVDESWLDVGSGPTSKAHRPLGQTLSTKVHEKEIIEATLAETAGRVSGPFRCRGEVKYAGIDLGLHNQNPQNKQVSLQDRLNAESLYLLQMIIEAHDFLGKFW